MIKYIWTLSFVLVFGLQPLLAQDTTFSYQGQLQQGGAPFTGTADLEFRLFTGPAGGAQVGPARLLEDWPVENGLFQVDLDFEAGAFGQDPRYLEVRVNGNIMEPRQAVRPTPVALFALAGNEGPVGPEGPPGETGPDGPPGPGMATGPRNIGTTDSTALNLRTSDTNRITILPNGLVGIGTTPDRILHTYTPFGGDQVLFEAASEPFSVQLRTPTRRWSLVNGFSGAAGSFSIFDSSSGGVRLLINTSGNVGIGTTSPGARLAVSGGDAAVVSQGSGIILRATNGPNCYRLTVNNAGTLSTTGVTCP